MTTRIWTFQRWSWTPLRQPNFCDTYSVSFSSSCSLFSFFAMITMAHDVQTDLGTQVFMYRLATINPGEKALFSFSRLRMLSVFIIRWDWLDLCYACLGSVHLFQTRSHQCDIPVTVVPVVDKSQKQLDRTRHIHTNPLLHWVQDSVVWVWLRWNRTNTLTHTDWFDLNRNMCAPARMQTNDRELKLTIQSRTHTLLWTTLLSNVIVVYTPRINP